MKTLKVTVEIKLAGGRPKLALPLLLVSFLLWLAGPVRGLDLDPVLRGRYDTSGTAWGVVVSGGYAYVADGSNGLQVIDVSNPAYPQRVGGNWTVDQAQAVFVTTNNVFVAARERGLFVLHPFTPLSGPALLFAPLQAEQNVARVCLQGLLGLRVEIERSADLRLWQSWTNGVLGRTGLEVEDTEANPRQFYRAFAR